MDDDQIRISETVDRSDPLTVDVVLEVHETIASVREADGFVRVRFRVPIAEWDAVLGRKPITYRAVIKWSSYDCGGANLETVDATSLDDAATKAVSLMDDDAAAITILAVTGRGGGRRGRREGAAERRSAACARGKGPRSAAAGVRTAPRRVRAEGVTYTSPNPSPPPAG